MNTRPKNPANARNLNCCIIGSSGSGKTRFWLTPQLLQAHSSYVVVDPKGSILGQVGFFLSREKYRIKVFNSIDFKKSMHYNPLAYIKTEADILKFVNALIQNTKGDGKEGDEFWSKCEQLLYSALIAYIVFEGPEEDRNIITLVDLINKMEVKEDNDDFKNAVDYMFLGLAKRKPESFAVRQYEKYKLSSGEISCKWHFNQCLIKQAGKPFAAQMDSQRIKQQQQHHERILVRATRAASRKIKKIQFAPDPDSIGTLRPQNTGKVTQLYRTLHSISQNKLF